VCEAVQAPTATLSFGSAFVVVLSMVQLSQWLCTEPSEVSTKLSPTTIGTVVAPCTGEFARFLTPMETAGLAIVTASVPIAFALLTLAAVTVRVVGSDEGSVRPE
jgi:hypothetical protein